MRRKIVSDLSVEGRFMNKEGTPSRFSVETRAYASAFCGGGGRSNERCDSTLTDNEKYLARALPSLIVRTSGAALFKIPVPTEEKRTTMRTFFKEAF